MSLSFNHSNRPVARHRAWLALLCVIAVAATSSLPPRHSSAMAAGPGAQTAPGDAAADSQAGMPADLREAVERARYRISEPEDAGLRGSYRAMNPAQAFSTTFTEAGLRVQPHVASLKAQSATAELTAAAEAEAAHAESADAESAAVESAAVESAAGESAAGESAQTDGVAGWQWGMSLRGYGYGEQILEAAPAALAVADNRIEYRRGELTEWYVNDERGIEQGFTLAARPAGGESSEPLVVRLSVEGELRAEDSRDQQHISFVGEGGARVLSYSGLVAFDARGKKLAARMRVAGGEVRLEVEDEGAKYPLTIDPLVASETKLPASGVAAGDFFGLSVAISGDTAVVGAVNDDTAAGADAGSAYVFVRNSLGWSQQAKLTASDAADHDLFGYRVAISGDTAVVGAVDDDTAAGVNAGSAYVFVRGNGQWRQEAKLTASDAAEFGHFGSSVAIVTTVTYALDGTTFRTGTIVVGTNFGHPTSGNEKSVYVFVRSQLGWHQQAELTASNASEHAGFGSSVAISGNTIVVGAIWDDTAAGVRTGSAYVFVRSNGQWSQEAKLTASDASEDDNFGGSVAISGNTIVVGANDDDTAAGYGAGSAYVFVRNSNGLWSQEAKLTASDGAEFDYFGTSVAISGNTIVVGARLNNTAAGVSTGSAYVYTRSNGQWSQRLKLTASDASEDDNFGGSVAISGNTIVVGANDDDTAAGVNAGSAYAISLVYTIPFP